MPSSAAYNLVALPSLTGNLNELPTMCRVEPNLIHLSGLSSTNFLSKEKLQEMLEHNPSSNHSVTRHIHKPLPPVDDEDHIMMRKPLRLPVHSVLPGTVMTYPPPLSPYLHNIRGIPSANLLSLKMGGVLHLKSLWVKCLRMGLGNGCNM